MFLWLGGGYEAGMRGSKASILAAIHCTDRAVREVTEPRRGG